MTDPSQLDLSTYQLPSNLQVHTFCFSAHSSPASEIPSVPPPTHSSAQADITAVTNHRRRILEFRVDEVSDCLLGERRLLQLHIRGTAFLWHQVGGREAVECGQCGVPSSA